MNFISPFLLEQCSEMESRVYNLMSIATGQ